jgi:hypothetical protein
VNITPANATNQNVTYSIVSGNNTISLNTATGEVVGVAAGTATVRVTTADGNKTATCTVTVNPIPISNAIETTEIPEGLRIYPNPVGDELYIQSEKPIEKIEILDIAGRVIIDNVPLTSNNLINVSGLPEGAYFVRVFVDNQSITKKIIKQ